jgi:hypothetical protein
MLYITTCHTGTQQQNNDDILVHQPLELLQLSVQRQHSLLVGPFAFEH